MKMRFYPRANYTHFYKGESFSSGLALIKATQKLSKVSTGKWLANHAGKHQRSKTNRLRFMLEGPWPYASFVLFSLTMHQLQNSNVPIGYLYERA